MLAVTSSLFQIFGGVDIFIVASYLFFVNLEIDKEKIACNDKISTPQIFEIRMK